MRKERVLPENLSPLLRLVEDYRVRCDVPMETFASVLGVSRLSYSNWVRGKGIRKHHEKLAKYGGVALKRAYDSQELPVYRGSNLTREERKTKIREVFFRYFEQVAYPPAQAEKGEED